jgi:hypothetical protein
MDTLDVLVKARVEVEREWWQGGGGCDPQDRVTGGVCAIHALLRVVKNTTPALAALCRELPAPYASYDVIGFNDAASTTKADVLALYDRAINAEAVKVTADPAHTFTVAA